MKNENHPSCFGVLDIVFPKEKDELRSSPDKCFECACKTECLKTALLERGGLKVHEETVDRAYESGMIGFLERWSKKKAIHRKKQGKK
ncbi:hypothetical protein QUF80_23890 [Desulfococcaceae bacterium HSG8]|nr:hypothetical protein [Desulfococcaceae bacterium HSG8]